MPFDLEVQHFLRQTLEAAGSLELALETLESIYHVKASVHGRYPELVLLKYSMIDSPLGERLVQECRGLILDTSRDFEIVAMPYTKFFNHGEGLAARIDWNTASVQEKVDGSLIVMWWYNDSWNVSTSGTADAECDVGDFGMTFAELFWSTFAAQGLDLSKFDTRHCYMFELGTPHNRVVVRHAEPKLWLHGARNLDTLQELRLHALEPLCQVVKQYPLTSLEACIAAAHELNPLESEGYVVVDAAFNRIKVKSPAYLALHHAKDGLLSRKKMALVIREGEAAEFEAALVDFPELRGTFDELVEQYNKIVAAAEEHYAKIKHIADQKEFAAIAVTTGVSSALFRMRKTGCSAAEFLKSVPATTYMRMMNVKEEQT